MTTTPSPGAAPDRRVLLLLLALAGATYFVNLGVPALWDANEPLYAQPPHEALAWPQGDVLAPTWNGKPYFAHAPLSTWLTLPFYAWLGPSELGHRLPMALAALLTVLGVWRLGRVVAGPRIGLLAAVVFAVTPRVWLFSRQLSGDVYMTTILVWAWALALPVVAGRTDRKRGLWWAHALVGLGFTAKGPVILVLYAGALFFAWLLGRPRARWAALRPLLGLALIVVLGAPWFVYMAVRYAELDFLGQHFGHYHMGRVLGTIGQRSLLFYPRILLGDAQPWITLVPFAAAAWWRRRERGVEGWFPWVGMLWILVFFTVPAGKRNVYMLPLYPLLAIAVAPWLQAVWVGASRGLVRFAGWAAAVGCLGGGVMLAAMAHNVPRLQPEIFAPIALVLLAGAGLFVVGWRGRGAWLVGGAGLVLVGCQLAAALSFPALDRFRPVPAFAARIRAEQDGQQPEPAVLYRVAIHSLNFYLDRPTAVAASADDLLAKMGEAHSAFVLVPEHRWSAVSKEDPTQHVGLRHELPEARFEELDRSPLLIFKFRWTILGQDRTTRDLLLLRVRLEEAASVVLARRVASRQESPR